MILRIFNISYHFLLFKYRIDFLFSIFALGKYIHPTDNYCEMGADFIILNK